MNNNLCMNQSKLGKLILFMIISLLFFLNNNISLKIKKNGKLFKIISKKYALKNYVNINEIESFFPGGRKWTKKKKNIINVGIQLDPKYILRVMMTLASIIDSQKPETKLRFHFAVVNYFNVEHMIKIYSLRDRIRDDIEFNFYNAKKCEIDLKKLNSKGPGAVAKLLLPNLLPKDVERLIVFDTGDLLVLRDLTIMYNWKMDNYLCLGIPGGKVGKYAKISKKKYLSYINTGSILISLDYIYINKKQRSNSYLENYNRRIREKLGSFLTKRGKSIIPWPLFLAFIINEENYFKIKVNTKFSEEPKKEYKYDFIPTEYVNITDTNNNKISHWLKWDNNSCRYDSFFFLFFTNIYKFFTDTKVLNRNNNISDIIKLIELIKNSVKTLNINIWEIAENNKNLSMDILNVKNGYKDPFHIHNVFNWFKGNDLFCITYNINKTFSICFKLENENKIDSPLISINKNDFISSTNLMKYYIKDFL